MPVSASSGRLLEPWIARQCLGDGRVGPLGAKELPSGLKLVDEVDYADRLIAVLEQRGDCVSEGTRLQCRHFATGRVPCQGEMRLEGSHLGCQTSLPRPQLEDLCRELVVVTLHFGELRLDLSDGIGTDGRANHTRVSVGPGPCPRPATLFLPRRTVRGWNRGAPLVAV